MKFQRAGVLFRGPSAWTVHVRYFWEMPVGLIERSVPVPAPSGRAGDRAFLLAAWIRPVRAVQEPCMEMRLENGL